MFVVTITAWWTESGPDRGGPAPPQTPPCCACGRVPVGPALRLWSASGHPRETSRRPPRRRRRQSRRQLWPTPRVVVEGRRPGGHDGRRARPPSSAPCPRPAVTDGGGRCRTGFFFAAQTAGDGNGQGQQRSGLAKTGDLLTALRTAFEVIGEGRTFLFVEGVEDERTGEQMGRVRHRAAHSPRAVLDGTVRRDPFSRFPP